MKKPGMGRVSIHLSQLPTFGPQAALKVLFHIRHGDFVWRPLGPLQQALLFSSLTPQPVHPEKRNHRTVIIPTKQKKKKPTAVPENLHSNKQTKLTHSKPRKSGSLFNTEGNFQRSRWALGSMRQAEALPTQKDQGVGAYGCCGLPRPRYKAAHTSFLIA